MNDEELKQFFETMDVPPPDSERKKEALNMAVASFEAQKSNISQNNSKNFQGSSWLARLISQINPERKDTMHTSNRKYIYGSLATACIALMVGANFIVTQSTHSGGGSTERESINVASADLTSQPSPSMIEAIERDDSTAEHAAAPPMEQAESFAMADSSAVVASREMKAETSRAKMAPQAAGNVGGAVMGVAAVAASITMGVGSDYYAPQMEVEGRDKFSRDEENSILQVKAGPVSSISIDVLYKPVPRVMFLGTAT